MSHHHHNSGDYYRDALPPLREHLRELFPGRDASADIPRSSRHGDYPHRSSSSNHHASEDYYNRTPHTPHSGSRTHHSTSSHSPHNADGNTQSHMFSVMRNIPNHQGLVDEHSSSRDDFHSRSARSMDSHTKRHACSECGERFERPATLEIHMRKHSGEKPYECPVKGCHKTFNVQSNMKRHERTHYAESAFVNADEAESSSRGSRRSHNNSQSAHFTVMRRT